MSSLLDALATVKSASIMQEIPKITAFLQTCIPIKNEILLAQPSLYNASLPPDHLPPAVVLLLSRRCQLSSEEVHVCWGMLKSLIWESPEGVKCLVEPRLAESAFRAAGMELGFSSMRSIWPPVQYCTSKMCTMSSSGRKLQTAEQHAAVLYTLDMGPLPVYTVHLRCHKCSRRYHHDFYVGQDQLRVYYDRLPDILQLSEHHFAETRLIDLWRMTMVNGWMSATNCAETYLQSHSDTSIFPSDWQFGTTLTAKHVYDGFTLLGLLDDAIDCKASITVPHGGEQATRFTAVVEARNLRIREQGQPTVRHYCQKCVRVYNSNENVKGACTVQVVVTDGITIGRPTCAQPRCPGALLTKSHRFCKYHRDLENVCSIVGCSQRVDEGYKTCSNELHRELESVHRQRNKAAFQLQKRKERARAAHPVSAEAEEVELDELNEREDGVELDVELVDTGVEHENGQLLNEDGRHPESRQNTTRLRGQFGRKRSHNEQILIYPCGVIAARETFLNAEAIPSVAAFFKRTNHAGFAPNHLIFDSNCILAKHVHNDPDFANIGLPVDVFHYGTKHAKTDDFCRENCNLALFPELMNDEGDGWFFNTSIAEQNNVWLGGYHAILQEMTAERFDFFLDEMIRLKNIKVMRRLEDRGYAPGFWR